MTVGNNQPVFNIRESCRVDFTFLEYEELSSPCALPEYRCDGDTPGALCLNSGCAGGVKAPDGTPVSTYFYCAFASEAGNPGRSLRLGVTCPATGDLQLRATAGKDSCGITDGLEITQWRNGALNDIIVPRTENTYSYDNVISCEAGDEIRISEDGGVLVITTPEGNELTAATFTPVPQFGG